MAFDAKVNLNGKTYDALSCKYKLLRDVDQKGRPSSHVYGVEIWAEVESTEDTTILEAMVNEYKPIKGSFLFKKGDEESKMKEFEFEDAYVVEFEEGFERKNSTPMSCKFKISARKVTCGNAVHEEEWPKA